MKMKHTSHRYLIYIPHIHTSHRYGIKKPRPKHGHKLVNITFEAQIMKKLSHTNAGMKKALLIKKAVCITVVSKCSSK